MNKKDLENLYLRNKLSVFEIANKYGCSENKINYWLASYKIKKRTIAEAMYQKKNPKGDPFVFSNPKNLKEIFILLD